MTLPDDEARKLAELVLDEYSSMHPEDAELIEEKKNLARKVKELLDRQRWIPVSERLPSDKTEKFYGGPEGSWGLPVLIITKFHKNEGILRLFGYFDSDDNCFYSRGEKFEVDYWMPQPPEQP
jgi:hypothetical protein